MNQKEINKKLDNIDELLKKAIEYLNNYKNTKKLDIDISNKYKEVFDEIYEECKKNNIHNSEEFKEKYKSIKVELDKFLVSYLDQILMCCKIEDSNFEVLLLEEVKKIQSLFTLKKDTKYIVTLCNIVGLYCTSGIETALKYVDEFNKKNKKYIIEPYNLLCLYEMDKYEIDIDKIIDIVNRAEKNNLSIDNVEVYKLLAAYYFANGKTKKFEKYQKIMLEKIEEIEYDNDGLLDIDDSEIDDMDYDEDFDVFDDIAKEIDNEIVEDTLIELGEIFTSKVQFSKDFEVYLEEKYKSNEELLTDVISIAFIEEDKDYYKEIVSYKNKIKLFEKNRYEVFTHLISALPASSIKLLKKFLVCSVVKMELNYKSLNEIFNQLNDYKLLFECNLIFGELKDNELLIHVPLNIIPLIKDIITTKENQIKNKKINKFYHFLKGVTEVYGVIDIDSLYDIYNDFMKCSIDNFIKNISRAQFFYNDVTIFYYNDIGYITNKYINDNDFKKILKKSASYEYERYPLKKYEEFAKNEYIKNLNSYKNLIENLEKNLVPVDKDFNDDLCIIIQTYILFKRLDRKDELKNFENMFIYMDNLKNNGDLYKDILINGFKAIYAELPQWNKKGKIKNKV